MTRRDDDVERELRTHLELEAEERVADGMSETDAQHAARRAFGSVARTREDVRAVWARQWLADLRADAAYALRTLMRNRGFAAVAIVTLTLGIGASVAVFTLADAVLRRPLPFRDPQQLVALWDDFSAVGGPTRVESSPADYRDWSTRSRVFDTMAAIAGRQTFNLTGAGDPERLLGAQVTGDLFVMLGLTPIAGRPIVPDDDRPDAGRVVVISEGLWRRRFGGDRALVGRDILLDDVPHTVVGIVPGDFQFPAGGTEVWVTARFTPQALAERSTYYLYVVGRLKDGVSIDQARADMSGVAKQLADEAGRNTRPGVTLVPLHEQYVAASRPLYTLLVSTVTVLLLIACVNVAHLLLARGTDRRREMTLRTALGASRGRVLRQLLTESVLLATIAAAVGLALAWAASPFLARLVPDNFPDGTSPRVDAFMLTLAFLLALVASVAFGVGPSLAATRLRIHGALRTWGTGGTTRRERRVRGSLVVAEVTMTVVLLVAAALLLRSYAELTAVDIGFRAEGVLVAETPLSPAKYGDPSRRSAFTAQVVERLESLPGVRSAGFVNYLPLTFPGGRSAFLIEGRPAPAPDRPALMAVNRAVSARYLSTLGVPLLRGRHFDARDRADSTPSVIINATMARTYWGNEDAVGKRIRFYGPLSAAPWLTIVGVVGDVHQIRLDLDREPELYLPFDELRANAAPFVWPRHLVVRTSGDPSALAPLVRAAVAGVDADQPVASVRPMEQVIDEHLANRSTQLTLIGVFSIVALALAAIGLYGVLAHAVARQTAEIGVRMALGATRAGVIGPLVRRALVLTGAGVVLGAAAAAAVTRAFSALLFEVSPTDPLTFGAVALVLMGVAAIACWAPARRATRIDPLVALRTE